MGSEVCEGDQRETVIETDPDPDSDTDSALYMWAASSYCLSVYMFVGYG